MECPHCRVSFHHDPTRIWSDEDVDGGWILQKDTCPSCKRIILLLGQGNVIRRPHLVDVLNPRYRFVRPITSARPPCPTDVPKHHADDYSEACLVIGDSPKASAALSRRCLQAILREEAGVKEGTLAAEIDQVLSSGLLPSHIADAIDAVRNIGNFAAHPAKSRTTGEIVPIEPREAEWNLDVLEALFDFYFVQPNALAAKKDALNKKLEEAGKPAMK